MSEPSPKPRQSRARLLLIAIWALLTLAVGWALFSPGSGLQSNGKQVATLTATTNQVRLMPGGSILWGDAKKGQSLAYGDTLSTGPTSAATIQMSEGRVLTLGPNSMVSIEEEGQGNGRGPNIALSLLRGEVVASVAKDRRVSKPDSDPFGALLKAFSGEDEKPTPAAMTIATPTKSFVVAEAGASLGLYKSEDALEPVVTGVKGDVRSLAAGEDDAALTAATLTQAPRVTPAEVVPAATVAAPKVATPIVPKPSANLALLSPGLSLATPSVSETPVPRAKRKPKAPPVIKAAAPELTTQKIAPVTLPPSPKPEPPDVIPSAALAPRIAQSVPRSLATPLTLAEACRGNFNVTVEPPPGLSGDGLKGWTPFVEANLAGQPTPVVRAEGRPSLSVQTLRLPLAQLCVLEGRMARETLNVTLRAGVRLKDEGPEAYGTGQRPLIFMSLAELPDRPVTVYLSRIVVAEGEVTGWLPMKSANTQTVEAPFALSLVSTRLLPRIYPLLRGNRSIVIGRQQPQGYAQKIELATSSGEHLGSLASATRKDGVIRRVSAVLGSDIAFIGRPESLISLPNTRMNRLNLLEAMVNSKQDVTLISRQRAVILRREDMQANPSSVRALGIGATAAFKGEVEIVLPK